MVIKADSEMKLRLALLASIKRNLSLSQLHAENAIDKIQRDYARIVMHDGGSDYLPVLEALSYLEKALECYNAAVEAKERLTALKQQLN